MLVQKKSQKRNIILGAIFAVLIVVMIFVLNMGPSGSDDDLLNGVLNNESVVILPAVVDIDSAFFGKKDVVGLRDRSGQRYVEQFASTPTDSQITPAPEGAYILNIQVGEKLILYWDFSSRYVAVKIYRSETQEKKGELIAEVSNRNYYQDTGIENGVYYYYTLIAVGANGQESDDSVKMTGSPTDIFAPQSPVGLAVADSTDGNQVQISWVDPKDKDFAYVRIYRSQIKGSLGTLILDKAVENNTYVDKNVLEDVEYFYTITSVDTSGNESEKSLLPVGGNNNPFQPLF
ncbi:hypothetical protein KJ705_01535 [Patescibacteria group bacterium]|nr:hypothetical protein [Patescibacteria group bacterium]MBU2235551.1 hypothetical protein [Patescibacteria group bacterium]